MENKELKFHPKFKENPGPTVPLQLPKNLKKKVKKIDNNKISDSEMKC